jgi:hypothetical protein
MLYPPPTWSLGLCVVMVAAIVSATLLFNSLGVLR